MANFLRSLGGIQQTTLHGCECEPARRTVLYVEELIENLLNAALRVGRCVYSVHSTLR